MTIQRRNIAVPVAGLGDVATSYLEAGDGPAVMLFHGGCVGGSADTWTRTMEGLAGRYRLQVGDKVGALLDILHTGKRHEVARDEGLRVREPAVERRLIPHDARTSQRLGISREPVDGAGAPPPDVREARAGQLDSGRDGVTGPAQAERRGTAAGAPTPRLRRGIGHGAAEHDQDQ